MTARSTVYTQALEARDIHSAICRWRRQQVACSICSDLAETVDRAARMAAPAPAPSASQWASAACHLDRRAAWRTVRIDGTRYVVLQSGNSSHTYILRADARGCGCPWYLRTGRQCSHMLALELSAMEDELREAAPAPVSLLSYRALLNGCAAGCGQVVEGPLSTLCDDCSAQNARRLDLASKRELVGSR